MLLAQDPKLLLVDEPVAGMTDAETEATARAAQAHRAGSASHRRIAEAHFGCRSFGRRRRARHGLRARARRQGDLPARGLGAGRGRHRCRVGEPARRRVYLDAEEFRRAGCCKVRRRRVEVRRRPGAARRRTRSAQGRGDVADGPQRRRQDDAAARHRRPSSRQRRHHHLGRPAARPACRPTSGRGAASRSCRRAARSFRC